MRNSPHRIIAEFDRFIRRDPAARGLINSEAKFGPLCPGHLLRAAENLAATAKNVGIVTGFYVPDASRPAAETDGPLGAALLAEYLQASGVEVLLITDSFCQPALEVVTDFLRLPTSDLIIFPECTPQTATHFLTESTGQHLTHLIAIERVGPGHTWKSVTAQPRHHPPTKDQFLPPDEQNQPFNMRGENLSETTIELHHLFEWAEKHRPELHTIGIGDGGNEIGMGSILWEELTQRLPSPHAKRIPCRIATDFTIIAGTSNWGAYALTAATALLRNDIHLLKPLTTTYQQRLLNRLITEAGCIDGITRLPEPTVDGLPFLTAIQPWIAMRNLLRLQ